MSQSITESIELAIYNTVNNIISDAELEIIINLVNTIDSLYTNSMLSETAIEMLQNKIHSSSRDVISDFIISLLNNIKYELGNINTDIVLNQFIQSYDVLYVSFLNNDLVKENVKKYNISDNNKIVVGLLLMMKQHIKYLTTTLVKYRSVLKETRKG